MRFSKSSVPTVVAFALGGVASLVLLPLSASAQPGPRGGYYYENPSSSFSDSSEQSSDSSSYGGPRGRRYLVGAAEANRPLTVLAVRAPRADDPAEAHALPGTKVVELADPLAPRLANGAAPQPEDLRIAVNDDRAVGLTAGTTLRPRMLGTDGVQFFAGSSLVAFVPTPAEGSGIGDGTRTRS